MCCISNVTKLSHRAYEVKVTREKPLSYIKIVYNTSMYSDRSTHGILLYIIFKLYIYSLPTSLKHRCHHQYRELILRNNIYYSYPVSYLHEYYNTLQALQVFNHMCVTLSYQSYHQPCPSHIPPSTILLVYTYSTLA